jgi:hypothetical protein
LFSVRAGGSVAAASMRVYALMQGIARYAAELAAFALGGPRDRKCIPALHTDAFDLAVEPSRKGLAMALGAAVASDATHDIASVSPTGLATLGTGNADLPTSAVSDRGLFHAVSITRVMHHVQGLTTVYNLEVEEDHSYVANGFVVHNCGSCLALHGSRHGLDEVLDDHPSGRCVSSPLTASWERLGFGPGMPEAARPVQSGEDWLRAQSVERQQQILGKAKWEAWQSEGVRLRDLVARRRSAAWGTMRYEASLERALAKAEARAARGGT